MGLLLSPTNRPRPSETAATAAVHTSRWFANLASTTNSDANKNNNCSELPFESRSLGSPLPFDEHACSVSLPTWSSVVGYEEGDQAVTSAMTCGYPRFVYHPYVLQLMMAFLDKFSKGGEDCLVLPTKESALRCQSFLQQALEKDVKTVDVALLERAGTTDLEIPDQTDSKIRVESFEEAGVYAVIFPAKTEAGIAAKAYWQHTGEIVSSRRASRALQVLGRPFEKRVTCNPVDGTPTIFHSCDDKTGGTESYCEQLQNRIAGWTNVPSENVFLVPSGMATMYKALRSARRYQMEKNPSSKGGSSIVYGFPYLDTLKLCSRTEFSPDGVEFFGKGDAKDLENLERLLEQRKGTSRWSALFTEVPSNPLLLCPELEKLRQLADEYDFCLVVDDTIGTCLNIDMIESGLADAVCTSLTKLVSGRGDVIAGSVVLNPHTEKGRWMQQDMAKDLELHGGLYEADARAVVANSVDFVERNARINETSEKLAAYFHEHPDIEICWYPKFVAPLFKKYQKGNGYGGLMSIHLHQHICQRTFYDVLDVAKGPSLGTNFTLVCPYTLLAHYHELDFAISYNVPPNLIRIAVGLEDFETLKEKFDAALNKSRLHPKIEMPNPITSIAS